MLNKICTIIIIIIKKALITVMLHKVAGALEIASKKSACWGA